MLPPIPSLSSLLNNLNFRCHHQQHHRHHQHKQFTRYQIYGLVAFPWSRCMLCDNRRWPPYKRERLQPLPHPALYIPCTLLHLPVQGSDAWNVPSPIFNNVTSSSTKHHQPYNDNTIQSNKEGNPIIRKNLAVAASANTIQHQYHTF